MTMVTLFADGVPCPEICYHKDSWRGVVHYMTYMCESGR